MKKERYELGLDKELIDQLDKIAKYERRTLVQQIEYFLWECVFHYEEKMQTRFRYGIWPENRKTKP